MQDNEMIPELNVPASKLECQERVGNCCSAKFVHGFYDLGTPAAKEQIDGFCAKKYSPEMPQWHKQAVFALCHERDAKILQEQHGFQLACKFQSIHGAHMMHMMVRKDQGKLELPGQVVKEVVKEVIREVPVIKYVRKEDVRVAAKRVRSVGVGGGKGGNRNGKGNRQARGV